MLARSLKELALLVADYRRQLGLTQAEVADRVGLKQKTISAFENNPERTMLSTAFLILSALHLETQIQPKHKKSDDVSQWGQEW